jgi:hypothetical protein
MDAFLSQVKADNPRCNQVFGLNAGLGAKGSGLNTFCLILCRPVLQGNLHLIVLSKAVGRGWGINNLVI